MASLQPRRHGVNIPFWTDARGAYNMQFASMVVIVYDTLITMDEEINLIWTRPWKTVNLLYLANRYFVLIESILNVPAWIDPWLSPESCVNLALLTSIWAVPVIITLIEALLTIRVCRLFCYDRYVTVALWALLFSSTVVSVVFSGLLSTAFGYSAPQYSPLYGCQYTNTSANANLQTWIWIPSIVVETILVILTVVRTSQHLRSSTSLRTALNIVVRDGCLYFIVVLGLMLANAIVLMVEKTSAYEGALLQPELSISSVLCSRMYLNLQKSIYNIKDAEARRWEGLEHVKQADSDTPNRYAGVEMSAMPTSSTTWGSTTWGTTTWDAQTRRNETEVRV